MKRSDRSVASAASPSSGDPPKISSKLRGVELCLYASCLLAACGSKGLSFPKGFLWGASTSAHQIEGNNTANDMWAWEEAGHMPQKSGQAADSWDLWQQDDALVRQAGLNAYRFSIEWSRLEPSPGAWDAAAEAHYRAILDDLAARGIHPMVTLHHYTNPLWINGADGGYDGWRDPRTPAAFEDFARRAAAAFGDRVDDWITINEPMDYAMGAYGVARFPPGDLQLDLRPELLPTIVPNLIDGHARAAQAIREADTVDADGDGIAARVGIAQAIVGVQPATPADQAATDRFDLFMHELFLQAAITGDYDSNLDGLAVVHHPEWAGTLDFIGVNYYMTVPVVTAQILTPVDGFPCDPGYAQLGIPLASLGCPPSRATAYSDMGWPIVPSGLRDVLVATAKLGVPLVVTENGIATHDDTLRERFLVSHLKAVHDAMEEGVDVRGYFVWSLIDNWEWGSFDPKFGLFHVDFQNGFARSPTGAVPLMKRTAQLNELANSDVAAFPPP